ncbi:phosphatidylcholine-sterol acyltransferase-like [Brevipalpus obovatus]|uniref:phosphatidylcholine-sterol acyltransferase-like n=1 Tax=Brevipalpus obovatus TaxID=246614 RepID=UPI003D9DCB73
MYSHYFKFKLIYFFTLSFQYTLSYADGPGPVGPVITDLNPVVLFPGLGGSRLEVRAEKPYSCFDRRKMTKYHSLWLNIGYLLPTSFDCFFDRIRLVHLEGSDYPQPLEGIHVRASHFGQTKSVEYLDSFPVFGLGSYMHTLVEQLVQKGLVRDVSIRAAPYDFRLGLAQLDDYFQQVKDLIEETYQINGQKRVTLICHSLGCLRSVHFLNNQPDSWKNKFVHEYITLAAPWAGSVDALIADLIGRDFGVPWLSIEKIRSFERTYPSIIELLPIPQVFGAEVLVKTLSRQFTSEEYENLFDLADCKECSLNFEKIVKPNIQFPRVNTTCIYGAGLSTPSKIQFMTDNLNGPFNLQIGDGDGTVNSESLSYCQHWNKMRDHFTFNYVTLFGSNHADFVQDTGTVEKVLKYIF